MLLALLLGACAPINPAEVTTPDPYHGDPPHPGWPLPGV